MCLRSTGLTIGQAFKMSYHSPKLFIMQEGYLEGQYRSQIHPTTPCISRLMNNGLLWPPHYINDTHEEIRYTISNSTFIHSSPIHTDLSIEVMTLQVNPSSSSVEAQDHRGSYQSCHFGSNIEHRRCLCESSFDFRIFHNRRFSLQFIGLKPPQFIKSEFSKSNIGSTTFDLFE